MIFIAVVENVEFTVVSHGGTKNLNDWEKRTIAEQN